MSINSSNAYRTVGRNHTSVTGENVVNMKQVNCTVPESTVTEDYRHISTKEVLEVFGRFGWTPVGGWAARRTKASKKSVETAKHMIRLENPELTATYRNPVAAKMGDLTPTLTIINSHDGGSSLRVVIGFTRLVCLNGLTVGEDMGSFSVRHVGVKAQMSELEARLAAVAESFDRLFSVFARMAATGATVEHKRKLVVAALVVQYGEEKAAEIAADAQAFSHAAGRLLEARRGQDFGLDLFTVVNVIQENLVKGNGVKPNSKRRGGIRSAVRAEKVTTRLMDYAMELLAA